MLLTELIQHSHPETKNHPALINLKKSLSYQDFSILIAQLSGFYKKQVGYQSRVAFLCANSPELAASFLALSQLRCISTLIDPELSSSEVLEWIRTTQASHLVISSEQKQKVTLLLKESQIHLPLIELDSIPTQEYPDTFTPDPDQTPQDTDPILLLRTQGSTGSPRSILFHHRQILAGIQVIKEAYRLRPVERFFSPLHWSHPFALTHALLLPLSLGLTCLLTQNLPLSKLPRFLTSAQVTRIIGTPPFYFQLLLEQSQSKTIIPSLKSVTVGLGFLSPELRKTFNLLNVFVCQVYGQAEALWTIAMEVCPLEEDKKGQKTEASRGFVGKALPGVQYKLWDQKGKEIELTGSAQGALALAGPMIMKGYERLEKESRWALRGEWLHTGDIVKIQKVGTETYLNFIGRASEFEFSESRLEILSRIDQTLKNNPDLNDTASFFMKTALGKLLLILAAVPHPPVRITEQDLLDYCKTQLPRDMIPQVVVFTDEIPRDRGGNPLYPQLRAKFSSMRLSTSP